MRLGMGLGLGNLLSGQPITGLANKYSFNFDGSNDYLLLPADDNFGVNDTWSVSFWVKFDSLATTQALFSASKAPTATNRIGITYHSSTIRFNMYGTFDGTTETRAKSSSTISADTWYHLVATNSNGTLGLYLNNVEQTGTSSYSLSHSARRVIGSAINFNLNFNGLIDEFAIWDTVLSASDVTSIYNNGKVIDLSKSASYGVDRTGNLKLWLRCGDKAEPESTTAIARQDFYTDFDGTDDYVDVGNSADVNFGTSNFSISTWINTSDADGVIYSSYDASHPYAHLRLSSGKVELYLSNSSANGEEDWASTATVNDSSWHYIAVSVDKSSGVSMYIDGTLETLSATGTIGNVANDLGSSKTYNIGRHPSNATYLAGKISNLSLYKTALDAQTISQMAKSRFTPMRDNRFSVVDFDGSNDYIDCGNDSSLQITGALSISSWIKTDNNSTFMSLVSKNDNTNKCYNTEIYNNGRLYFRIVNSDTNYAVGNHADTQIADGDWHHYCCVFEPSTALKIYIDGELKRTNTTSIPATIDNDTVDLEIGRRGDGANYFDGSMSSVAVYNTAKSAEEVYAIYQQGITYDESSLSGLVGYWRMGDDTSKAYPTIADSSSNSNDGTITNGASDDIVQQMVAGYDLGAFESSSEELQLLVTDGDWTIGGSWVYDSSTGYYTNTYINGTETPLGNIIASPATTVGRVYKLSYTVVSTTGSPTLKFPNNMLGLSSSNIPYTVGETNVHYGVDDGSSENIGIRSNTGVGTIVLKDIKFEEVLQSEVSDTHPAIIDVNEPVLGAELFTNGWTNDGNGSSYPPYSGSFSYDASANTVTATSGSSGIYVGNETFRTEFTAVADAFYKITFTTSNTDSAVQLRGLSSANHLDTQTSTPYLAQSSLGNANQVFYLKANASATRYIGFRSGGANRTITVSNFSIKQVFGNVGLMTNQATSDLVYSSVLPDQSFLTGVNSAYNFIDLDGSDEYIDCGTGIGNFLGDNYAGDLSLSMWFKADGTWQEGFFDIGSFSGTDGEFNLRSWGNVLSWYLNGTSWEVELTSFTSNDWNHIALVYTAGSEANSNMYLNGSVTGSKSGTFPSASDLDFNGLKTIIGARKEESGTTVFNGKMGQVALYNKALSATEVSAINTLGRHGNLLDSYSDNLLGYWAMSALDAKTGLSDVGDGTIYDRSGNSNHGTATNTESTDLKSSPNAEPNGYAKGDTNRSTTTP